MSDTKTIRLSTGGLVELPAEDAVAFIKTGRAEPYIESDKAGRANERVRLTVGDNLVEGDPTRGFKSYGHFLQATYDRAVCAHNNMPHEVDDRLDTLLVTKAVGSDEYAVVEEAIGGYLCPPQFDPTLLVKKPSRHFVRDSNPMSITMTGDTVVFNVETDVNRTSGNLYGGVDCFWTKERGQFTPTKGTFEQVELKAKALTAITHVTNKQMHYAPQTSAVLARQFDVALLYKELEAFMYGTGAGEPMGMSKGPATYVQAAVTDPSSQAAETIVTRNVLEMYSRCWEPEDAVWLASDSCFYMLNTLTIDVGTGGAPIALMNIDNTGIRRLLGRPIFFNEFSKTLGTEGDLAIVNWTQYLLGQSTRGGMATSIHFRFEYDEVSLRFIRELDGQPWWRSNLTLQNGWVKSPYVTLAARE